MNRQYLLKRRLRQQFLVTTKDGATFSGILFAADDRVLVLRHTEAVGAGENKTNIPLDGEIIVLLPDVAYLQRT